MGAEKHIRSNGRTERRCTLKPKPLPIGEQHQQKRAVYLDLLLRTTLDGPTRDELTDELIGLELHILAEGQMKEYHIQRLESQIKSKKPI